MTENQKHRGRERKVADPRRWIALLLSAAPLLAVATLLAWLNGSSWWGWALVGAGVVGAGALSRVRVRPLVRRMSWAGLAVTVCAVALVPPPLEQRRAGGLDRSPTEVVSTQQGPVTGVRDTTGTVEVFAGVPYAAPPVDELRWRAPRPPAPRDDVLVADWFSAVPVQARSTFTSRALSRVTEVPLENTFLNPYPVSEDSLTLNIWRRADRTDDRRPVLVYVPGGGFSSGSGALPLYDGQAMAARGDIVTVTINYRLGVLGFLAHPELSSESGAGSSGNYGILDQLAALQWVRDNIAAFGGDPDRVTVAGESAGGESVCILGATPLASGLVHGIIGGSGACMGTTGDTGRGDQSDTRAVAEEAGRRLSEQLGGASIEQMRAMPAEQLMTAGVDLAQHWRPSVDGHVLDRPPSEIYQAGEQHDVPILVGSNADEASLALASPPETDIAGYAAAAQQTHGATAEDFLRLYPGRTEEEVLDSTLQAQTDAVMTRAMLRWARLHEENGLADAYLYFFTHVPPEPGLERFGAYHGAEVGYAYDNLAAVGDLRPGASDRRLRDQMTGYWLNFVRSGDPNSTGAVRWPTLQQSPERLLGLGTAGARLVPRPRQEAIDFWLAYDGPIA